MIGRRNHSHPRRGRFTRVLLKFLLLAVIFIAGGVCGWLYGVRFVVDTLIEQQRNMAEVPDRVIPELEDKLRLTEEQFPEFDRIFREYHAQMTKVEAKRVLEVHELWYEMGKEILPLLDDEQATKFRDIHDRICSFILGPIPEGMGEGGSTPEDPCKDL